MEQGIWRRLIIKRREITRWSIDNSSPFSCWRRNQMWRIIRGGRSSCGSTICLNGGNLLRRAGRGSSRTLWWYISNQRRIWSKDYKAETYALGWNRKIKVWIWEENSGGKIMPFGQIYWASCKTWS